MIPENDPIEVTICLGSSCFARGNAENLSVLKKLEQTDTGKQCLRLKGSLCQEHCKQGPNVRIGGECHHGLDAAHLRELLQNTNRPASEHGKA
jgi:NADH:ubiquinone oxidoreductase subunit E